MTYLIGSASSLHPVACTPFREGELMTVYEKMTSSLEEPNPSELKDQWTESADFQSIVFDMLYDSREETHFEILKDILYIE